MATITPDYMMKGVSNPFYDLDTNIVSLVKQKLKNNKALDLKFKCVHKKDIDEKNLIIVTPKGSLYFQVVNGKDDSPIPSYLLLTKKQVKGHYGMSSRKDSTASSNVNEYLSVYFLTHKEENAETFDKLIKSKSPSGSIGTGVYTGAGVEVTYEELRELIDKDESPDRDICIGFKNACAVRTDIGKKLISKVYWVPRGKPEGIAKTNPSDVIIQFTNGCYVGYSNKIAAGKDATPKFNTNIVAFYSKLSNPTQSSNIKKLIDCAWTEAQENVLKTKINAWGAINNFNITKEDFSESSSKNAFAKLAYAFKKDKLDFYKEGFYYPFRNTLIKYIASYLTTGPTATKNLIYFLNTIAFYTYGPAGISTPCPYKLLIGQESGASVIKDVSDNVNLKTILENTVEENIGNLRYIYDGNSQSFKICFCYSIVKAKINVEIPITCRTRASGGWAGKSLFVNSPGLKIS